VDDSRELLRSLILGVAHLCTRTRELAESGQRHPLAVAPVRESVDMVLRNLQALEALWGPAGRPPAATPAAEEESWLLEPADEGL
jgi:hypothetical protein